MPKILHPEYFKDKRHEIILASSEEFRKKIVQISTIRFPLMCGIELVNNIHVMKNDKIIFTGNHLAAALRVYNKI